MPPVTRAVTQVNMGNLTTTGVQVFSVLTKKSFSAQVELDVNTPSAFTFPAADVNASTDIITEAAHGQTTGIKGQMSTSGVLPAGLAALTDYFLIVLNSGQFKVASSLSNALAGTAIDITDQGTGNHTFTPTALAGLEVKLQKSNKSSVLSPTYTYAAADWEDVAPATAYTMDDTFLAEVSEPTYLAAAIHVTLTAGRVNPVINYTSRFRDQP